MTIRKGEGWGRRAPLPPDGVMVHTDAEARAVVLVALREGRPVPTLGLLGGDLCRTLGGLGDAGRLRSEEGMTFPIDLGHAIIDGRSDLFVAHLIARRSWWRGRAVAVMNAQWLGDWDLGPRSHPNDGLLDATDGDLALGDRWVARRRVRTGSHLPHPGPAHPPDPFDELRLRAGARRSPGRSGRRSGGAPRGHGPARRTDGGGLTRAAGAQQGLGGACRYRRRMETAELQATDVRRDRPSCRAPARRLPRHPCPSRGELRRGPCPRGPDRRARRCRPEP